MKEKEKALAMVQEEGEGKEPEGGRDPGRAQAAAASLKEKAGDSLAGRSRNPWGKPTIG
ncbi:MAG: hypothetical protein ACLUUO_00445 [Sellimonas intestinalis]